MRHEIFVDTGAWIALIDGSDRWHVTARRSYPAVLQPENSLVTTNLVIAETYAVVRHRLGHAVALRALETLQRTPRLTKVYADAELESEAEAFLHQHAATPLSLVDAVSFAVMRQREIHEAFAFDPNFLAAGFVLVPILPELNRGRREESAG